MTFTSASARRITSRRTSLMAAVQFYLGVWRQRRVLNQLDDAALKDVGLTRAQAEAEARRAVWDVPQTWRW